MKRFLRLVAILLGFIVAGLAVFVALTPAGGLILFATMTAMFARPAPPLLEHVSAASGWYGACPPKNEKEAVQRSIGEALSPELNQRLAAQFPAGSREPSLVRTLTEQGFTLAEACQSDPTIRHAWFRGRTRGSIFETIAEIYWKTENDTVIWTKGFVFFYGL